MKSSVERLRAAAMRFVDRGTERAAPEVARMMRRARGFGLVAFTILFVGGFLLSLWAGVTAAAWISVAGMTSFAFCLRWMARSDGRHVELASHTGLGLLLAAITTASLAVGGATPISVTYPTLLILAAMYMLGVRAAAFWTALSIASLALVVFTATLPPPEAGAARSSHALIFSSRALVLAATFAIASLGRRFEDRQSERLEFLARHDPLTGLVNRREFEERLQLALARCRRYDRHLALLFIDLDGFKRVNDRHGHGVGDDVLRWVGRTIQERTRDTDVAGRIGGDEFLVLLEDTGTEKDAGTYARRLLERLERATESLPADVVIRASIGVAVYPEDAGDAEGLTRTADAAMYRAKRAGGHRLAHTTGTEAA